jgi:hypothetical protein
MNYRVRWKLDYLEHLYGEIHGMNSVLQLAKDTDFDSWAAWRHWFRWIFTNKG